MEQIEKALARAREMRAGNLGGLRTNGHIPPSVNGFTPRYTETAIAKCDQRRTGRERLVADSASHPASDIYGLLRTQVLQRMKKHGMSTLAVTGPELGSGVTTTAANLAIAIALDVNQTVLLVDLNLRSPAIHEKFGFEPRAGIDDYLRGEVHLKDCLVCPGLPRLVVLPAREAKGETAEIISSPRMTALAKELQNRYADRIIIYDTPPLLTAGDTLGFLPNVDAVLLVARSGRTTKAELDKSAHLLGNKAIVGTLLNAH
ncbi:MAG TPA: CpsD/CapB family tyrosine-protein kinase [Dongiaceae bacterium]|jgi:Mrp family chromosome partitioning ATPase|nr:CpsD/CapB family tyrosine-protein kinase [Dongiaceae bacterium]